VEQPFLDGLRVDLDQRELDRVRAVVLRHLGDLGFDVSGGGDLLLRDASKRGIRMVYAAEAAANARALLARFRNEEDRFVKQLASRRPEPRAVVPYLQLVVRNSETADLWGWIVAHWSVPVSQGYGRRMRFIVRDAGNSDAIIGVIGLSDPVFSLSARDRWLDWDAETRKVRLSGVMEAFALGAVPPYDSMLGGKLVAMICASAEVKEEFRQRYQGSIARMSGRSHDGILCAVTTQSAFGRSSMYNRLRRPDGGLMWVPLGYTTGSGDGHIFGEAYHALRSLWEASHANDLPVGIGRRWKSGGARNKKDILFTTLPLIGLDPRKIRQHGIRRQSFIAPMDVSCFSPDVAVSDFLPASIADSATWWSQRWGERAFQNREPSERESWRLFASTDRLASMLPECGIQEGGPCAEGGAGLSGLQ
jgi:hypothetical protein